MLVLSKDNPPLQNHSCVQSISSMPVGGTWNQALESGLLPNLRLVNFEAVNHSQEK